MIKFRPIMKKLQIQLGRNIQKIRKQKGLTQAKTAELLNLSTNFIGYIERGIQAPSVLTLEKIAEILNVNVGMLFCNIDIPPLKPDEKEKLVNNILSKTRDMDIDDIKLVLKLIKRFST